MSLTADEPLVVADADVVIAYIEETDAQHPEATEALEAYAVAMMHPLNMAEVLVGVAADEERAVLLDDLTAAGFTPYTPHDADRGVLDDILRLASLRAAHRMKMPDTCALQAAVSTGLPLLTFDARLRRAATAVGVELAP